MEESEKEAADRRLNCKFHESKMEDFQAELKEVKELVMKVDDRVREEQKIHEQTVALQLERVIQQNSEQKEILIRFDAVMDNMREQTQEQKAFNQEMIGTMKEISTTLSDQKYNISKLEETTVTIQVDQEKMREQISSTRKRGLIDLNRLRDTVFEKAFVIIALAGLLAMLAYLFTNGLIG